MSLIFIGIFMAFKQYKSIWSIASIDEFLRGIIATGLATSVVLIISYLDGYNNGWNYDNGLL